MRVLQNNRHERFCQLVASGKSQSDAYRQVYPKSKGWKEDAVHVRASELAGKVSVRGRVTELKEAGATKAVMNKVEACILLSKITRSPDGDGGGMASRLAAIGLLAKLLGWYEPEKHDVTHRIPPDIETLTVLQGAIRK